MSDLTFTPWPKTPRLAKAFYCTITEKLDGTNAQFTVKDGHIVSVGSRNRFITPGKETDNFGFAAWVAMHAHDLAQLGEGTHYGEWYGRGIGRGYDIDENRLALFGVDRHRAAYEAMLEGHDSDFPTCVGLVPVLYRGAYDPEKIQWCMESLAVNGSYAVDGYMKPEGIVIAMDGQRAKLTFDAPEGKWAA